MEESNIIKGDLHNEQRPLKYDDAMFRYIICLPVALFITLFHADIAELRSGIIDPFFYVAVTATYFMALFMFSYIRFVTMTLDNKGFDWRNRTVGRTMLQTAFGFMTTGLFAFLLATAYFVSYGLHIFDTRYLTVDFPIILLFIVFANLYYLAYYAWHRPVQVPSTPKASGTAEKVQRPSIEGEHYDLPKLLFLAKTDGRTVPIPYADIACFIKEADYYQVRTFNKHVTVIEQSLVDVERELNSDEYFRITRTMIVNYRICGSFGPYKSSGQLELQLLHPMNCKVIIGRNTAQAFVRWMER